MLAFVLAASAVAAAVVPGTWVRVSLGLVALLFVAYTAQEEVRLGRLRRTLVDERVLRAALSNRIRELSSLSEVSKALNSVLDLDDVLGLILDSCLTLLEATDGSVKLLSDDEESLVTVSSRGEGATPLGAKQPAQSGVSGWVARRREPLLVSRDDDPALFRQLVPEDRPVRTSLAVPLVSRNRLLGVLSLNETHGSRRFSEYDLHVMSLFAEHAAIAIANARLYQTERENVARLLELDRLKSEFVATVSHELRTPLTSILGSAGTLLRSADSIKPADRDHFLTMIDRQGRRLLRLIEDILFAARIESGGPGVKPEMCDISSLAFEAVDGFRATKGGDRIQLLSRGPQTKAFADPMAVQQVIVNLCENALKYATGTDPIDVVVTGDDEAVSVTVSDNGPGVPASDLPYIFDRFRQVDGSLTRRASGVGLGLYIVRNLVEAMSGRVWCESEPGHGARFTVTLPVRSEEEVSHA